MSYKLVGLKMEAEDFLKDNLVSDEDASVVIYGDDFDLYQYDLKEDILVKETVQHIEGDNVYLCLEDEEGRRLYEWSDEEITNA